MSIDVNVQNDLVIVTESSEDITVNVSNAAGSPGVGVPTGGSTGQVLKKFSNTNYDTYWAADASGLTSVGLSMPSAFTVSNTPLTTNGTIAVSGAGTASQYVRGDGQLANFPTNGGGGSSVNYYLNGSVNQGTFGGDTYYEMSKTPIIGTGTNFTRTNAQGNGYIASFITDAGDPALLNIPGGNWNVEFYFAASSSGSTPSFYAELYKVSSSNVFTLIASGSTNPEGITQGTVIDQYFTSIAVPQTSLLTTDRLAIRIFVTPSGRTITLHTEDNNLCEVLTTFSTGLNALNGLTSQVQYFATGTSGTDFAISSATDTHTFNLPTASATNRGALSSADWSTFSGKVGGSGVTGQVAYWNGTNSQTGSNNLFWDAANARLGIGGITASRILDVRGTFRASNASGYGIDLNSIGEFLISTAGGSTGLTISDASNAIFKISASTYAFRFVLLGASQRLELRDVNQSDAVRLAVSNTGNLSIGSSTDGGQRLQVYGDAFVRGSGATSATNALLVQNSASTEIFRIYNDGTSQTRIALVIGTDTNYLALRNNGGGTNPKQIEGYWGGTTPYGIQINTNISTDFAVGNGYGLQVRNAFGQTFTTGNYTNILVNTNFSPTSGTGTQTQITISPTISQSGGANGITRGLYVNPTLTAAADWRSIEWSNNTGWGLYGAGTARNYLGGALTLNAGFLQSGGALFRIENTGGTLPTGSTGNGIEIYQGSGISYIESYNRTTSAYTQLNFRGSALNVTGNTTFVNDAIISGNISVGTTLYTSSNRVGIGTATPAVRLEIANGANQRLQIDCTGGINGAFIQASNNTTAQFIPLDFFANYYTFQTGTGTSSFPERMRLTQAGRLLLGTTTESTFLLDVNGTARVSGKLSVGTSSGLTTFNIDTNSTTTYSATGFNGTTAGIRLTNGSAGVGRYTGIGFTGGGNTEGFFGVVQNASEWAEFVFQTYNGSSYGERLRITSDGSVLIGTATASASSIFQINSTTKGFLPPRMNTTQKNSIAAVAGLVIYDTDTNKLQCYNGTTWNDLF